jgi:hypothetical protein
VHQILGMLANGDTIEELLEEYPSLIRGDILACLDYAAALAEEQVTPLEGLSGDDAGCGAEHLAGAGEVLNLMGGGKVAHGEASDNAC